MASCQEEGNDLSTVDERVSIALNDLREKLTAPEHGWVLNYQPVNGSGSYYILLNFEDEVVRIQSDVPYDEGYLYDQTIPYGLDAQVQLQLTFETYAVFHYLFEQEQSTFGGEFEFYFSEELDNGNLIFRSKTDETIIQLIPAAENAANALSREEAENMQSFALYNQPFGTQVLQQLYLSNDNVSVFWEVDLLQRIILPDFAVVGNTNEEIAISTEQVLLNENPIGFTYLDGSMVLFSPLEFNLGGKQYSISEIGFNDLTNDGITYCSSDMRISPIYSTTVNGLGDGDLRHTLFHSSGLGFVEEKEIPYSVNVFFVGDSTGISMTAEDEVIGLNYPDATGFIFHFGLTESEDTTDPAYALGINYEDENGIGQTDLRGYDAVTLEGNYLQVTLNEEFYYSKDSPTSEDEDRIRAVTDEVIGSGQLYITEWPIRDDLVIFRLFNPCNGNEFILVQP